MSWVYECVDAVHKREVAVAVMESVCRVCRVTPSDIMGTSRHQPVVLYRHLYYYLLNQYGLSPRDITSVVAGAKERSTLYHSVSTGCALAEREMKAVYRQIEAYLKEHYAL